MMLFQRIGTAFAAAALLCAAPVLAQSYSIDSVSATAIGTVAAASTGVTTFTVDPATGIVTKKTGNGARVSVGNTRSLITISCGNQNNCDSDNPKLRISQTGSPANRANALTNFALSVSGATGTIVTPGNSGNSVTVTLGPIGKNLSKTIYVGMDASYSGDNVAAATGPADVSFAVTLTRNGGQGSVSSSGQVTATVLRTLTITSGTPLSFGRVSRPRSGSGTVRLTAGDSAVQVAGDGVAALSTPAPTPATLTASGEGGQALTITVPSTFTMTNGANSLTVTTNAINSGGQTLGGSIGSAGTKTVTIGGSFPLTATTALGAYTGSFVVTFQYN